MDQKWLEKPLKLIKSPHKLTEPELYQTLLKIVELPEARLKKMIKQDHPIDEVFLLNLAERVPQFLTPTLVNITQAMLLKKEYFKDHPLWQPLELELHRRRNQLDN